MTDLFARALRDWYRDEFRGPLRYRDGEETAEHDVAGYFEDWSPGGDDLFFGRMEGPVLDMGAGAGRQALYCQQQVETVALEPSDELVEVLRDRGVKRVEQSDMFSLRETFDRDAFRGAYSVGTQVGIAKSLRGLRGFLGDLAYVTTPDATVLFDGYDPAHDETRELIGFREDPAGEVAYRFVQYEYDGELGRPWLFRLFAPAAIREAVVGTGWTVDAIEEGPEGWRHTYNVLLSKR